jgi:hypothetical protein
VPRLLIDYRLHGPAAFADVPLRRLIIGAVTVIPIVLEHGNLRIADAVDDATHDGGFSSPGASGHADNKGSLTLSRSAVLHVMPHFHSVFHVFSQAVHDIAARIEEYQ